VLPGNQQSDNPVSGRWHSLSVSTPPVVHIIKTSQFRCRLASRPGGSAAPVLSPAPTPVDAQPASLPAENTYDVILIDARLVEYTAAGCARAAGLGVAAVNGNWSGARAPTGPASRATRCSAPLSRSPTPAGARRAVTRAVDAPGSAPVATDGGRPERRGAGRRDERPRRRTDLRPGRLDAGSPWPPRTARRWPDRLARGRAVHRPCPNWPAWPRRAPGPTGTPPTPAPCPDGCHRQRRRGRRGDGQRVAGLGSRGRPDGRGRRPAARMEPFAGELVGRALAKAGVDVRIGILAARPRPVKVPLIWRAEAREQSSTVRSEKASCLPRTDRGFCDASPVGHPGRAPVRLPDLTMCGADRAATLAVG